MTHSQGEEQRMQLADVILKIINDALGRSSRSSRASMPVDEP